MIQKYTAAQLKEIKGRFDELNASMTRISAERDLMKEIYNDLKDKYEVPSKIARKLAKTYYKRNLAEVRAENDDLVETYETVFENSKQD
jgi:Transcriptional regulator DsbA